MQAPFTVETDGQSLRADFRVMESLRDTLLDWTPIREEKGGEMQISRRAATASLLTVMFLVACGGENARGNDETGGATGNRSAACIDTDEPIKEDLTFTGGISAHATSDCNERITEKDNCTRRSQSFGAVLEKLRLGGKEAEFGINLIQYHGPGTYAMPAGSTTQYYINLNVADGGPMWAALKSVVNTVVVNPDERSGTIDAELEPNGGDASGNVHVTGSWRCLP